MQFVCRTCSAVHAVVPERETVCTACGARLLTSVATRGEHAWYTRSHKGQAGPFDAAELARMFDRDELAFTDEVWRLGLRDWRPARKDDVLVVAVASARGLDTATMRLDALPRLLAAQDDEESLIPSEDTVIDAIPAGLASSWPVRPVPAGLRPSRTQTLARTLKLATLALVAFVGGGLVVGLCSRLAHSLRPSPVAAAPALQVAGASMVTTAPIALSRPRSGELVKRTLPALDEVRVELQRLAPSVRRCLREPKLGLAVELTIAGASGKPSAIDVRTPRLTPGMIECTTSALEGLRVAPFTADQLRYSHHFTW